MRFTANFYTRITGALVLAYAGYRFGTLHSATPPTDTQQWATILLVLCGAGMGLVLTHHLTLYPFRRLKRRAQTMTAIELMTTTLGARRRLINWRAADHTSQPSALDLRRVLADNCCHTGGLPGISCGERP